MASPRFNRIAFYVCLWMFCVMCLIVILTSCTPWDPFAALATQPGTAQPSPIAATKTAAPIAIPTPAPLCADVIALEALNIRTGPGIQNSVIATLGHGDQVTVIQAGAWWQIRTAQGLTGWAYSNYLKSTTCGE